MASNLEDSSNIFASLSHDSEVRPTNASYYYLNRSELLTKKPKETGNGFDNSNYDPSLYVESSDADPPQIQAPSLNLANSPDHPDRPSDLFDKEGHLRAYDRSLHEAHVDRLPASHMTFGTSTTTPASLPLPLSEGDSNPQGDWMVKHDGNMHFSEQVKLDQNTIANPLSNPNSVIVQRTLSRSGVTIEEKLDVSVHLSSTQTPLGPAVPNSGLYPESSASPCVVDYSGPDFTDPTIYDGRNSHVSQLPGDSASVYEISEATALHNTGNLEPSSLDSEDQTGPVCPQIPVAYMAPSIGACLATSAHTNSATEKLISSSPPQTPPRLNIFAPTTPEELPCASSSPVKTVSSLPSSAPNSPSVLPLSIPSSPLKIPPALGLDSSEFSIIHSKEHEKLTFDSSPNKRRKISQIPPNPWRPTAISHKTQRQKLVKPFRPPAFKKSTISSGPVVGAPLQLDDVSLAPQQGGASEINGALYRLANTTASISRKDYTLNAAKQFKSPFTINSSSSSSYGYYPQARLTPTVQSLERTVQNLRRAIKIKEEHATGKDDLERLANKWKIVGRDVAWEVWALVKDNTAQQSETGGWGHMNDGLDASTGGSIRNWGLDGADDTRLSDESTRSEEPENEDDVVKPQDTLGTMLRQLRIDPTTLGWNDEAEDFLD